MNKLKALAIITGIAAISAGSFTLYGCGGSSRPAEEPASVSEQSSYDDTGSIIAEPSSEEEESSAVSYESGDVSVIENTDSSIDGEWKLTTFTQDGVDILPTVIPLHGYAKVLFENGNFILEAFTMEGEKVSASTMGTYTVS